MDKISKEIIKNMFPHPTTAHYVHYFAYLGFAGVGPTVCVTATGTLSTPRAPVTWTPRTAPVPSDQEDPSARMLQ